MKYDFDVIVIGGGPAGATAAIYASREGMKVALFEKNIIGGQIVNSSKVENIPGFEEISGIEFGMKLESQLEKQGVFIIYDEVTKINTKRIIKSKCTGYEDNSLKFSDGSCVSGTITSIECGDREFTAKAYIIATGCKHRTLNVIGETELIGAGISFCALCDGPFYKDKTVAVIGGGNSALTEAIELSEIASEVIVIQDLQELTAQKKLIDIASAKENIKIYKNLSVLSFRRHEDKIKIHLIIGNDIYNGPDFLVDGVFEAIGFEPETELLKDTVALNSNYVESTDDCSTSIYVNLFAAGDVRYKNGIRQVVTACADGAQSATTACMYIRNKNETEQR